jgi:hypothetical protein
MKSTKTAAIRLTADQASENKDGYLILYGSPADEMSSAITRIEKGEMVDERAKSKTAANKILRDKGFQSPMVILESWRFSDPITNDHHNGKVWVMQLPKQGSARKKSKSPNKRKSKTTRRSRAKGK